MKILIVIISSLISFMFAEEYLAVMTLDPIGVSKNNSIVISERLTSRLISLKKYTIIERTNVEKILKEQKFQYSGCTDTQCAVEIGKVLNSNYVLIGSVSKLGSTYSIDCRIINVETSEALSSASFTSKSSIDDLLNGIESIAIQLYNPSQKDFEETVETETETETSTEKSLYRLGFSMGYLYPINNKFAERVTAPYSWTTNDEIEVKNYSQIIKIGGSYYYEFPNSTSLLFEGSWSIPHSWGVDASFLKLLNSSNYSPFIGGGLGVHWVGGVGDGTDDFKKSGATINFQTGLVLYRSYDINLLLRVQYLHIFNTMEDNGIVVDLMAVKKPKPKQKVVRNNKKIANTNSGNLIYYIILGLISTIMSIGN